VALKSPQSKRFATFKGYCGARSVWAAAVNAAFVGRTISAGRIQVLFVNQTIAKKLV